MALPTVDFDMITDLKARMSAFTTRFDQFILAGREQLRKERNEYVAGMAEDRLTQRAHLQSIEQTKLEQQELDAALRTEKTEVQEMSDSINEYSTKKSLMNELKESLGRQVEETQEVMAKKREALAHQRHHLALQNAKNRPELSAWETQLGLEIDAAGTDLLRFTYTHINDGDSAAPHFFIINLSSSTYHVEECHPALPTMEDEVMDLNKTRDFSTFLKNVRRDFKRLHKASK